MKHIIGRNRIKRKDSFYFRQSSVLFRNIWDLLRFCPTIFEIDLDDKDCYNPCRSDGARYMFVPWAAKIGEHDTWWQWLVENNLAGKVTVKFWFTAWYSTRAHSDPFEGKIERGTMRIAFSNKASAMLFKLNFASPKLKVVQMAV